MKIGLSTAAFYGKWEVEEAAAHLRGYGAECAEVFFQTRSEYTREFARLTRDRLDGLPCTSVHPFGTAFENEFFGRSARQRADAMDMLRRVLDAAAELDARLYVYHGRYSPARVELPFDAQRNAEVVARMQEEATQRKIKIAWENVCWCQLTTPERAREIRRLLPEIRFTLDIKQAMRAGRDPIDFVDAMGEQLANVHVCDWDENGRLCLPGKGTFDFTAFIRTQAGKLCGRGDCGALSGAGEKRRGAGKIHSDAEAYRRGTEQIYGLTKVRGGSKIKTTNFTEGMRENGTEHSS